MVNIITPLIHSTDLDYTSILGNLKNVIIDEYLQLKKEKNDLTSMPLDSSKVELIKLNLKLNRIIEENYFVGPKIGENVFNVYIQNNKNNTVQLHDHLNSMGVINAVFYLNIPKQGGEIMFRHLENSKWGKETIIKPEVNKVYLFPYWLPHTPLPQQDEIPRVCINWCYGSTQRPIHKFYKYSW